MCHGLQAERADTRLRVEPLHVRGAFLVSGGQRSKVEVHDLLLKAHQLESKRFVLLDDIDEMR